MDQALFLKMLSEKGFDLTPTQIEQFQKYFNLLIEWNQKINLTAITEMEEVYLKHFYDSLMVLWELPLDNYQIKLVDVGAGAGFPSIPIKIVKPEIEVTIIDSLNKRILFLNELIENLELDNVEAFHGRAEDFGQNPEFRGQFDVAMARAVAPLNVLSEFCLPLVKKGGNFIALKALKTDSEIKDAQVSIKILGAKLDVVVEDRLPIEESERTFIKIKKTLDTPKQYPRKAGKPVKQPIK